LKGKVTQLEGNEEMVLSLPLFLLYHKQRRCRWWSFWRDWWQRKSWATSSSRSGRW